MKKHLKPIILTILLLLLLAYATPQTRAQSQDGRTVSGQVLDDVTGQPIPDASVSVWNTIQDSPLRWRKTVTVKTDLSGVFTLNLSRGTPYRLYVYKDRADTPGFDYTPAFKDLPASGGSISLNLRLLPAASIVFDGELWFVEATEPSEEYSFTIVEEADHPRDDGYVYSYGSSPPNHNFLNASTRHVIVPLGRRARIEVNASILVSGAIIHKVFEVDLEPLNLSRGGLRHVDVEEYTTRLNYGLVEEEANSTAQSLAELSGKGFYTVVEEEDLARIEGLLGLAGGKMSEGLYNKAFTDLKEAYLMNSVLAQRLESLYSNAVESVSLLTIFMALTSITLSLLLFESPSMKYASYPLFFILLFTILYYAHPGCRLTPLPSLMGYVVLSLGGVAILSLLLPKILMEKVVSTFSISKRNLRRRRSRFALTTTTIIILVIGFVSLTSFSTGYGLTVKRYPYLHPNLGEGVLIQHSQPSPSQQKFNFVPLNPTSIKLITEKPGIKAAAPKAENQPSLRPLGQLWSSQSTQSDPFYGVIGIQPSAEAEATGIDGLVTEGRYLRDGDEDSILVSEALAARMGVEVNACISLAYGAYGAPRQVTVVGFFDGDRFRSMREADGREYSPPRLRLLDPDTPPVKEACEPDEVIIMTFKEATELYGLPVSRLITLLTNPQDAPSFAREVALEQGLSAWYSEKSVYEVSVAPYLEDRGISILIPWVIVVLNVLMTMLNSIFEYRREVSTLSAVGLNPSDIMGLFIAEAAVIGVLGGGVGYILGLSSYKVMSALSIIVEVRPKVSAAWSLASVLVSVSAVLVGALVALKYSVDITPSTLRRWRTGKPPPMGSQWVFQIPFKVKKEELKPLFNYVEARFRMYLKSMGIDEGKGKIIFFEEKGPEGLERGIYFKYLLGDRSKVGSFPFKLVAKKEGDGEAYSFEASCKGPEEIVRETVSFLRMSIIEWSSDQNRG